jgi:hypothetical protein
LENISNSEVKDLEPLFDFQTRVIEFECKVLDESNVEMVKAVFCHRSRSSLVFASFSKPTFKPNKAVLNYLCRSLIGKIYLPSKKDVTVNTANESTPRVSGRAKRPRLDLEASASNSPSPAAKLIK